MSSVEFLQFNKLNARTNVAQVGTNGPSAIRLRWLGDGAVTSVTVSVATNIVLIGVDGGTSYTQTYAFAAGATLNTAAKLVAAINAANCTETAAVAGGILWEAKVLDSLYADSTINAYVTGVQAAVVVDGETFYDVKTDTDGTGALHFVYRISGDRKFDGIKGAHRVGLKLAEYYATVTGAADSFQVWKSKKGIETQLLGALSVNNTLTTPVGSHNSSSPAIMANVGRLSCNFERCCNERCRYKLLTCLRST